MTREFGIRVLCLYGPAVLVALPWALGERPPRRAIAAFLALAWNVPALSLVNAVATRIGWWTFPSHADMPPEMLLGWVLLWGAAPVLLVPRAPIALVVIGLALVDVVLMPLAHPMVILGDTWLIGEVIAIGVALIPSQLVARWTEEDRHVEARALVQAIAFSGIVFWILPGLIFEQTSGSWAPLVRGWNRYGGLAVQAMLLPALMGLSAVQEFAVRGQGTPIPFDPPKRLVTSGPYAYVANPMQLSVALVLVGWGAMLHSVWVALGGVMAVIYSVGLARTDERSDLAERFGEPWRSYRRRVSAWRPRWRPYHPSDDGAGRTARARLYVAESCGECSRVGRWFSARHPRGLDVVPAELHPSRDLTRITYDPCEGRGGRDEAGVAAIARALEHVHLGWAMVGWLIRLPGLVSVLQLLVDASGGEARTIPRAPDATRSIVS